ncbi:DUF2802 domain-containing protein [Pseudoalteromonas sp. CnMc7-15]|uniref:DUF2802 domain-containing protein n=1 Tax=Pseudoalteromonas TaxID=53246 RepID=UPI001EF46942|nr:MULTISPECIES: DUF2802 domain-containing protein [Pseudoalteromonas]MCG7567621.1 DUF2802 domain-containing protein [Pseudoalteromonas sp. CnMc7-15]|tara:strand:- start:1583 stop:1999 length:417 start_codon:yes stop_codon:yes gene_type:complete
MKDPNLLYMIAASIVLLLAVLVIVLWLRTSQLARQMRALRQNMDTEKQASSQTQILRAEVSELRTALENMSNRIGQIQQRTEEVAQQQDTIREADPQARIYSRAVKMIELGAPMEEVMSECELPRAEAELLFSLHQKN